MSDVDQGGLCATCGRELTEQDASSRPNCAQCAFDAAEKKLDEQRAVAELEVPEPQAGSRRKRAIRTAAVWAMCAVAAIVIVWQLPAFVRALAPEPPLYSGTVRIDAGARDCVAILWKASAGMSGGHEPPATLACPLSGRAYVVSVAAGVTTVACPNPQDHGLISLSVASDAPVPVVR